MNVRQRWIVAGLLWAAVLWQLEMVRLSAPVRVFGPGGKSVVVPRGVAEAMAYKGRLRRAPDDVMRAELGLPPRVLVESTSDHTQLAGIDAAPEE